MQSTLSLKHSSVPPPSVLDIGCLEQCTAAVTAIPFIESEEGGLIVVLAGTVAS